MDIPQISLPTGGYSDPDITQIEAETPQFVPASEAASASGDLAHEDTVFGAIERISAKTGLFGGAGLNEQGTKLSPEEANARFPGMTEPFREEVTPSYARFLSDRQTERADLERKIQNGPDDLVSKSRVFGAGLIAHLLDPVEFGVGAFAGMGVGVIAGRTALGASLAARASTNFGARAALNFTEGAAAGGVATAVQEGGVAAATTAEGGDYDSIQGLENIAIGTMMGGMLGAGIKEGTFRLSGKTSWEGAIKPAEAPVEPRLNEPGRIFDDHLPQADQFYRETSPEAGVLAADHAIKSLDDGRTSMAHVLNEAVIRESDVNPGKFGREPYIYEPLADDNSLGRKFYVATSNSTPDLNGAEVKVVSGDLGIGMQMTDNPGVANALSAPSMADSVGNVHEVVLRREPRLAYESAPVPAEVQGITETLMKHLGIDEENPSLGKVLEAMKDAEEAGSLESGFTAKYADELRKAGYDALISDGASRYGVDVAPHNKLTILADDLITHSQAFEAEPKAINQPTGEMAQALKDHHLGEKPSMWIDENNMKAVMRELDAAREEMRTVSDTSKVIEEQLADFDRLNNTDGLLPEDLAVFESVKQQFSLRDQFNEFTLNAMKCMGG